MARRPHRQRGTCTPRLVGSWSRRPTGWPFASNHERVRKTCQRPSQSRGGSSWGAPREYRQRRAPRILVPRSPHHRRLHPKSALQADSGRLGHSLQEQIPCRSTGTRKSPPPSSSESLGQTRCRMLHRATPRTASWREFLSGAQVSGAQRAVPGVRGLGQCRRSCRQGFLQLQTTPRHSLQRNSTRSGGRTMNRHHHSDRRKSLRRSSCSIQ
mmetsp:Transcript_32786/g.85788  ORF Transcript_32786/g.85788 Transcript_32786/m.85788 type:complete len:212 (-) Transcript_32786:121-756(-)